MHITKKIQKAERRFDTRAEWFLWHHPVLGYLFVLIGMPLLVLLWYVYILMKGDDHT